MDTKGKSDEDITCKCYAWKRFRSFLSLQLIKKIWKLSWPVILTFLTGFGVIFITYLFVGRLGSTELAASALALSITNVTGFSVAIGLSTAFDTFCSQAIGAKQMKKVGIIIQRGLWIMTIACFVVWGLWLNSERLMVALHQDKNASRLAAQMCDVLSMGLPSRFLYITVQKYLQTQGIVRPVLCIGLTVNCFHVLMNYLLLFVLHWGIRGAGLCIILSETLFFVLMLVYIKWKKFYKETWPGWSQESLLEWGAFSKVALAGLGMISIEWCAFEVGAFLIGSINKEELGAFAVTMQMAGFMTMIPIGLALSSSILVGQNLGSGKPSKAQHIAKLCLFIEVCVAIVTILIVFAGKNYLAYAFTDDRMIIELATKAVPVFMMFHFFDALQAVAGGIVRGCGLQGYGIWINFFDYNVIGIPLAVVFSIVVKMNNFGFWLGLSCGIIMQFFLFLTLLWRSDWNKLSKRARERAGITSVEDLFPIPPVHSADVMTVARSIGNLTELSKSEETSSENKELSSENIELAMIQDESRTESSSDNTKQSNHIQENNHVSLQGNGIKNKDDTPEIAIIKKTNVQENTRVTLKIKIMRFFTILAAVLIWLTGVLLRVFLPPINYPEDSNPILSGVANITNSSSNRTLI